LAGKAGVNSAFQERQTLIKGASGIHQQLRMVATILISLIIHFGVDFLASKRRRHEGFVHRIRDFNGRGSRPDWVFR
jgi:hypothetical protein